MRKFAISDIHGCLASFKALLEQINFNKEDELYLLGDYIDRGPDSKGVIDLIWELQSSGHNIHCLRGNHEQLMLDGLDNAKDAYIWIRNGGIQALKSFEVEHPLMIPRTYKNWLKELPYYFEVDNYILVHAGLNFDKDNPFEDKRSLIWTRYWHDTIDMDWLNGRIIIHGHTPIYKEKVRIAFDYLDIVPALDIDAGCVFDKRGFGYLCAFDMTNKELYFQKNVEPVEDSGSLILDKL